jgi:hypothetical protein
LRYSRERAQKDFARFLKDLAKEERNDSLAGRVTQTWEQALGC